MTDVPRAAQYTFAGAAFFALVGFGFFAFIFFWKPSTTQTPLMPAPSQQQQAVQEQSPGVSGGAPTQYAPSQSDPLDAEASAKLKALEAVNAN